MEALQQINAILDDRVVSDGPLVTGDPLVDKWEKEIAEGTMPDLGESLDGRQ